MFCNTVSTSAKVNLDEEIEMAFELINNEIVSHKNIVGSESSAVDKGKISKLEVYPIIRPVETIDGSEYEIYFYSYIVCEKNKNNEGISEINIIYDDVEYKIGDAKLVHPNL